MKNIALQKYFRDRFGVSYRKNESKLILNNKKRSGLKTLAVRIAERYIASDR